MGSVRKKGDRWYFSVELPAENGKRKRVERAGGKTKKEAMRKMAEFEAKVLKKGYQEETKLTFRELFDIWIKEYVELNCTINTLDTYKNNARLHIFPRIGDYKIVDIKPRVINNYFNTLKKEGYRDAQAKLIRNIISSCLSYGVFPLELIEVNPCKNVKMPKFGGKNEEKKIISTQDLNTILEEGQGICNFREMCLFLYNTGMRVGEALALRWEDVDFDNRIIHIKHTLIHRGVKEYQLTAPKTPSSIRDIYFNLEVEKILKSLKVKQSENKLKYGKYYIKEKDDLVFRMDNGKFITQQHYTNAAARIKKKTNINFSMHLFRHTHATLMLESGATMKDVQTRLGHANINTTMNTYVKNTEDAKKEALKKFDYYVNSSNI